MTVTFSRYILVWERTLEQSSHTTEWARTLRFGAGLLVPVQGAAAGCRCKVLLSECCVGYGAGLLCSCRGRCRVPVLQSAVCALEPGCWCTAAVACAAAVASFARCCPGCKASFHIPSSFSGPEGPWWVGMPFSLVLASFWPRSGCVFFCLCYGCCGAASSIGSTNSKSSTSSRKSNAQRCCLCLCWCWCSLCY